MEHGNKNQQEEMAKNAFVNLYNDFCDKMPTVFIKDNEDMQIRSHEGGIKAIIPLASQLTMEALIDSLAKILNVNILYAFKTQKGQHYEAVGYSKPCAGQLYILLIKSCQHGIVNNIEMLVYNSYEPMFAQVRQLLTDLPDAGAEQIFEEEKPEVLYSHFFK